MKTLQELYREIISSEELKAAFAEAAKDGKAAEFLKAHGCEATTEELTAFLKTRSNGEISDEELDSVAGGCNDATSFEALFSTISVGVVCIALALDSSSEAYAGRLKEGVDGRICQAS